MADVQGTFYQATKVKVGTSPSSPGLISGTVPVNPVNPEGTTIGHVPVSIGGYPNGLTIDATTQVLNLEIGDGLGVDGYGRLEATGGGGGTPTAAVIGRYDIDTSGTTAPVGTKDIRYNNATQISATELFISDLTEDNIDVDLFLSLIKEGAALVIQDRDDHLNYQTYEVSGTPSFASATWTFPVTFKDSGGTGTTNFANNHKALLSTFSSGNGGISDAPNDGKAYTRKSLAWAQSSPYDLKQEGATDGQVLAWSTANSRFQPTTASGGGNFIAYDVAQALTSTQIRQANSNIRSTASQLENLARSGTVTDNNLVTTSGNVEFSGTATITLTGVVAGYIGEEKTIYNRTNAEITILGNNASSSVGNRFFGNWIIPVNGFVTIKYLNVDGSGTAYWQVISTPFNTTSYNTLATTTRNPLGFGRTPIGSNTAITAKALGVGGYGILVRNFADTADVAYINDAGIASQLNNFGGGTSGVASFGINVTPVNSYVSIGWKNSGGTQVGSMNTSGDMSTTRGIAIGFAIATSPPANTRLVVRGYGTTTNQTVIFEDSAGTDNVQFLDNGNIIYRDGSTWQLGTTTGTKIGTATNQKLSFWNKTPIIQPTTGIAGAALVGGGGTTITDTDTFGGYTVAQLAAILINTGLTA